MTKRVDLSEFAVTDTSSLPKNLGIRYSKDAFLPEAGNTIVCHLDWSAPEHAAILEARSRIQALPGAQSLLFTPESSLHMTVFEGVIETRRTAEAWPADLDRDLPVDDVTTALLPRMQAFNPPPAFAVRACGIMPLALILEGVTEADRAALRAWRDAFTEAFGYRHKDHDDYVQHMTLAYPTDWLPEALVPQWEKELEAILTDLVDAAPVIPLTAPAFCTFADMTHFEEVHVFTR